MQDKFNGKLGSYKVITTEDGSTTLWSEYYQEACHSDAGAKEETLFNYVFPCKILETAQTKAVNILEVGFGLGHGVVETFKLLDQNLLLQPVHFVSLEIDEALIHWAQQNNNYKFDQLPSLEELTPLSYQSYKLYRAQKSGHTLDIVIGDATKILKDYLQDFPLLFNAIYQDAFSPKQNPELWSEEWFQLLYQYAQKNCVMSTYSCAGVVKRNLKAANWNVKKRDGFKKKREALIIEKI